MPAAAFFVSTLTVVFSRSLAWGPALVLLLLSVIIAFEPLDGRTAKHLIDAQAALWLGAVSGFLFLLVSSLDRLVNLNLIYPSTNWPLIGVFLALVIVAAFGTLTVHSYRDGSASVLDFSLLVGGILLALVAFAMLWWTAKFYRRTTMSTVKYGLVLALLALNVLAWPTEHGGDSTVYVALLFGGVTLAVYVGAGVVVLYFRIADDPLPLVASRLVLLVAVFFLQMSSYVTSIAPIEWGLIPLVIVTVVWPLLFGYVQRCVAGNPRVHPSHVANAATPHAVETAVIAQRGDASRRRGVAPRVNGKHELKF